MTDVLTRMRRDWEQRAQEDPLHYIACDQRDPEDFASSGRIDASRILDGLPRGGRVLEIGAGMGRLLVEMEDEFQELVGVDISPRMVELAADYLDGHPKIQVLLNDGASLAFEDQSFDAVFSYIVFQHIPERAVVERYIAEAHRVLKPGGTFRFQVYRPSPRQRLLRPLHLDKPTTWRGYNWTETGLRSALESSPFGGGSLDRYEDHLWATCRRGGTLQGA